MRKRENEKKKTQSPENPRVFQRPPSFVEPMRNDGHNTPTPQPTTPSTIRIPAKREKTETTREKEISKKKKSASVQFLRRTLKPPSNRHQTTCYHHEKGP